MNLNEVASELARRNKGKPGDDISVAQVKEVLADFGDMLYESKSPRKTITRLIQTARRRAIRRRVKQDVADQ